MRHTRLHDGVQRGRRVLVQHRELRVRAVGHAHVQCGQPGLRQVRPEGLLGLLPKAKLLQSAWPVRDTRLPSWCEDAGVRDVYTDTDRLCDWERLQRRGAGVLPTNKALRHRGRELQPNQLRALLSELQLH